MLQDAIINLTRKFEIKPTADTGPVWYVAWEPVSYGFIEVGSRATVGRLNAEVYATEEECKARVLELGGEWQDEEDYAEFTEIGNQE